MPSAPMAIHESSRWLLRPLMPCASTSATWPMPPDEAKATTIAPVPCRNWRRDRPA